MSWFKYIYLTFWFLVIEYAIVTFAISHINGSTEESVIGFLALFFGCASVLHGYAKIVSFWLGDSDE